MIRVALTETALKDIVAYAGHLLFLLGVRGFAVCQAEGAYETSPPPRAPGLCVSERPW